ncbi:RHS repeat domain-containing protein, partial [Chryseobacterium sp. CBo1]|uniref:RHS repeat domain-containing protein n=1 Tax=Chryseobacterium sp. CBo1 TaxID=1869230 RepID=UPI000AAC530C
PTAINHVLSVNYYDTYPLGTPGFTPTLPGNAAITDNFTQNVNTKSLPVASYVKNIEDDDWTKNYTWYDNKGRAIATHSINHFGGYTKKESQLDFSGTPKQVVTRHKRLDTDVERLITENFTYDHQNRLLEHTHQVDGNAVEYLAQNEYNELSQLKSKKVGGTSAGNGLQTVDYAYNIRGWMTGINDPNDLSGGDLFGYKIKYNQVEGQQMPNNDFSGLLVQPKYNGNIAEVDWRTNTTVGDNLRRYGYVYDGLNRLRAGFYQRDDNPTAKEYFEKIDYDLNGNITNLKRSASKDGNTTAGIIDDLTYSYNYPVTGNRLNSVTDSSTDYRGYPDTSGIAITYDLNGNMEKHEDKGILYIEYNSLNLPNYIKHNDFITTRGGKIYVTTTYVYRSDGVKIRKLHKYKNPLALNLLSKFTDYLDGYQYANDVLQFVPTSEGYYDFVKNKYIYNYADHLGNTRLSYFHNGSSIEVLEENNYYPFGLKHDGYNALAGNPSYQYKYNGKELQETGMYDYGARFYMSDIGRWGVVDPAAEYFPYITPYSYVVNDPIGYVDNDGEMPGPVGAIIGIFSDYIMQVGVNYFLDRKDFRTSLTDVSGWSLAVSGVSGFATGGISALTKAATSGIGKQALVKTIDFGVDVLVSTVESAATNQLETGEFDIWKSFTGGLLEAGIGKFIPLKYVDKLESKLARKMNISGEKMTRYKNRMQNDVNRSRSTRARNNRKYAENKKAYENYTKAFAGVKVVNDAYKAGGAEVLQNIDLFKKTPEETKKPIITVGELTRVKE